MSGYLHDPKMIVSATRTFAPYRGFTMVDPSDRLTEALTNFWSTATNTTMGGTYAQVRNPLLETRQSSRSIDGQDIPTYIRAAEEGCELAARFSHPNFPIQAYDHNQHVDWWVRLVWVDAVSSAKDQAEEITKNTAEAVLSVRTFFRAEGVLPKKVAIEVIPSDAWRFNTNIVAIWIPIDTHMTDPMAELCLARLEPSMLVQVIHHFVRERLRVKGGFNFPSITLAMDSTGTERKAVDLRRQRHPHPPTANMPSSSRENVSRGFDQRTKETEKATKIANYCRKCLPDITLDKAWTKNSITALAPRSASPPLRPGDDDDDCEMLPPTTLPPRTHQFAKRRREEGREVPAWAQSSAHARVLPPTRRW